MPEIKFFHPTFRKSDNRQKLIGIRLYSKNKMSNKNYIKFMVGD